MSTPHSPKLPQLLEIYRSPGAYIYRMTGTHVEGQPWIYQLGERDGCVVVALGDVRTRSLIVRKAVTITRGERVVIAGDAVMHEGMPTAASIAELLGETATIAGIVIVRSTFLERAATYDEPFDVDRFQPLLESAVPRHPPPLQPPKPPPFRVRRPMIRLPPL